MANEPTHSPLWPPSTVDSFDALDRLILNRRGALYEGDIFSILKHSPYVVRSFEFAHADGMIHCSSEFSPDTSFADRFWDVEQDFQLDPRSNSRKFVLFDVKSKVSRAAGDQIYSTTVGQRRHVAFYIGICAADPSFVDVIPNYYQGHTVTPSIIRTTTSLTVAAGALNPDNRHVAVNNSRVSKLPPSAYTLDPCGAPHRMPIGYLTEAVARIRRCALGWGVYVNPHTMVPFPEWRPATTNSNEMSKPIESAEQFSAYEATLEIYRFCKTQPMKLDFMGLQPRVADFKLLQGHRSCNRRQVFVQHKLDARDRVRDTPLTKVAIARGQGDDFRYYFSDIERFDFLFYQFSFSDRPSPRFITEFFFIPEREIPDVFYATDAVEESFEYPHFAPYRARMDKNGDWIQHVLRIIRENPQPRQTTPRPSRLISVWGTPRAAPSEPGSVVPRAPMASRQMYRRNKGGRGLYKDSMTRSHRQFYFNIMLECAKRHVKPTTLNTLTCLLTEASRGSGLLSPLATDHPMADYSFTRYQWKEDERADFLNSTQLVPPPPETLDHLPGVAPGVPIYYYARNRECSSAGPTLTPAQFRRLNSCHNNRLVIWNIWGPDEADHPLPLIAIPSEDLCPTLAQRELYAKELAERKTGDFPSRSPTISHLLTTGLSAAEYSVGHGGPLVYEGPNWGAVWEFLIKFTQRAYLEHPKSHLRDPATLRCPLWMMHERLAQDDVQRIKAVIQSGQEEA